MVQKEFSISARLGIPPNLRTELSLAGYDRQQIVSFVVALAKIHEYLLETKQPLPRAACANISRFIGIIAQKHNISAEIARQRILDNMTLLLTIEGNYTPDDLRKIQRESRLSKEDRISVRAALQIREEMGRLPLNKDGGRGLPPNSRKWAARLKALTRRGTTLGKLIVEFGEPKPEKGRPKKIPLPPNHIIGKSINAVWDRKKRLPEDEDGHEDLPIESPSWSVLRRRLPKEKNITFKKIFLLYGEGRSTKLGPQSLPLPSNDIIGQASYDIKKEKSRLPNDRDGAEKLPQGSPGWSTIGKRIRQERSTTIKQLAIDFEKALTNRVTVQTPVDNAQNAHTAALEIA